MRLCRLRCNFKKGFWTFDLLISTIVILTIFYIAINTIDLLSKRIASEFEKFDSIRTLLLSERLVKRDLAKIDSTLILANVIDENFHDLLDGLEYYAFPISIRVFTNAEAKSAQTGNFGQEQTCICVRRFVLYKKRVGYLEVCAGESK